MLENKGYENMKDTMKMDINLENRVETIKPLLGALILIFGIGIILFSNWGGGINLANIVVGLFLAVFGVIVSLNGRTDVIQNSGIEEVTQSSKENKKILKNHVTIVEEVVTRTVKDENM
jgi:uncharacterized protein (DUF58 family)